MEIDSQDLDSLIRAAIETRTRAYAPYSNYPVGAAALGQSDRVYTGCNIENASFGLTVCAERVAIFKAVSEGDRIIRAIAVCSGGEDLVSPCGACLQVMAEFAPSDQPMVIITCTPTGTHKKATLSDYLPHPFSL